MYKIFYLKTLALRGAGEKPVRISSSELESSLGTSSKTIARNLKHLEEEGLIERTIVPAGQEIEISDAGLTLLRDEFADYKSIFRIREKIEIEGNVASGLGEGKYYIGIPGYAKQFKALLGYEPFPGTLNVRVRDSDKNRAEKLSEMKALHVSGFSDGDRTYGGARCYMAEIRGIECMIIVPERTHYRSDLLEIISPVGIRKALDLKDGDAVKVIIRSGDCGKETNE